MFISTFVPSENIRSARCGAKYWGYKGEGSWFLVLQEPSGEAGGAGVWRGIGWSTSPPG